MDNPEDSVSLSDFIAFLPVSSFPRIIKIASGVYLQSSVYDISGSECCLSTGDLLKVIGKELQSVHLVNQTTEKREELPDNFQGVFEVCGNNCAHATLGELHEELSCGDHMLPYWFTSASDFIVGDHVVQQQLPVYLSSVDKETHCAECQVYYDPHSYNITIPLSTQGQFYECKNTDSYTLEQVLLSPVLLKRTYKCSAMGSETYKIFPVFEVKTVMHMRKGFVFMPSSLEVDVVDITDECENFTFIQPLSLEEVCERESKFPVVAEILHTAECNHFAKNDTYSALQKGKRIVIHRRIISQKVLATGCKGKTSRFFYIHKQYKGKFRRRPREFSTIYDLWTKVVGGEQLSVVVTQDCESSDDNFPSLCIGDHLHTVHHTKTILSYENEPREVDVLMCNKESTDDEDEEEVETIMLPLYMEGRFVEEVKDHKKYSINNIIEKLKLPCEVKVVAKDASLSSDPLPSFSSLRLEEMVEEPVLLISLLDNISECFELPIKYLDISLILQECYDPSTEELTISTKLEELMESFYYSLRKDLPNQQLPPPRPPKRQVKPKDDKPSKKTGKSKKPVHPELKNTTDIHSKTPALAPPPVPPSPTPSPSVLPPIPVPPIPPRKCMVEETKISETHQVKKSNVYLPTPRKNSASHKDSDSDHDYEDMDKTMNDQLKITQKDTKKSRYHFKALHHNLYSCLIA
ncbi:protein THEMIS2 [Hyperolius riggenbachi]|uniref:protein THEMIS2 n=1 Tax=Hyperolius riggenbachi TaxID=752182 RepID=UPI0035A3AFD9